MRWVVYGCFCERLVLYQLTTLLQDALFSWPRVSFQHGPDDDGCRSHLCSQRNNVCRGFCIKLLSQVVCRLRTACRLLHLVLMGHHPHSFSSLTWKQEVLLGVDLRSGRREMPETKLISRCHPRDDTCCLIYKRTYVTTLRPDRRHVK